jgi:hypothetical protein
VSAGWGECRVNWSILGYSDEITNLEVCVRQTYSVDLADDDIEAQFFRMPLLSENLQLIWKYYVEANRVFKQIETFNNVKSSLRGGTSTIKEAMADARKLLKRILHEIQASGEERQLWDELATVLVDVAEKMNNCRINFRNWKVTPTPGAVLGMVWSSAPSAEDSPTMIEKSPRIRLYGPARYLPRWVFNDGVENRLCQEEERWQYREI